jgi:probable HAF family extracellular repeat protein
MSLHRPLFFATILLVITATSARADFIGLGFLAGGTESAAEAISADGSVVVGRAIDASRDFRAFRWTAAGGMQSLGVLGSDSFSLAHGVSADGSIVVGESVSGGFVYHAFRWTANGGMQSLGYGAAYGLSPEGLVIVGGTAQEGAFRWTAAGGLQSIGVLPGTTSGGAYRASADGSVLVGHCQDHAFIWTAATGMKDLGFLPGGRSSGAYDVSADGSIVVGASDAGLFTHAFRLTESGGMQDLGLLPNSYWSEAHGISADGNVIAGLCGGLGDKGFVWDGFDGQMHDLRALLEAQGMDPMGWSLRTADAVSGDAVTGYNVVGWGVDPQGFPEAYRVTGLRFAATPVPAPSTFVLVVLGSVLLGAAARTNRPRRNSDVQV